MKLSTKAIERMKKHFEANLLDGYDVKEGEKI